MSPGASRLCRGLIGALLAGWCVASLPIAPATSVAWAAPGSAATCPGCLVAGAASVDVTPPIGVPLAGYGAFSRRLLPPDLLGRAPYAFWLEPSRGVHDPIMVRALLLESLRTRLLWVAIDLIGIDRDMVKEVRSRLGTLGLRYDAVIISASHTHSGPGAFARSAVFEPLVLDRHVSAIREQILGGIERAALAAETRKAPARTGAGRGEVPGVIKSRVNGRLDHELGLLKIVGAGGRPIALLWNYSIHGTALGARNLLLSGDVMGETSRALEIATGAPALYANGAEGDVSPSRRGWEGVRELSAEMARGALAVWGRTPVEMSSSLSATTGAIALPRPRLSLRNCVGRPVPKWATIGLSAVMPRVSEMVGVAIGGSAWVTVPGELQASLGQAVKADGRRWFQLAFVAGLSNDYLGYFLSPEEYRRGGSYIGCAALYGEEGGQLVVDRAREIFKQLHDDERQRPGASGRR